MFIGDPRALMTGRDRRSLLIGALTGALIGLAAVCTSPTGPGPSGRLVGRTDCKAFGGASAGAAAVPTSSQECVEYDYDGRSLLRLKHVNAGFNCCPGTISADLDIFGGTVRITETESSSLCDCSCLYDLSYKITALPPGTYRLEVIGPYQPDSDPPLAFDIDLGRAASGSFCVGRTRYPWGY
jgi:hypothetical protein